MKRLAMKEEKDMRHSDSSKTDGGVLRSARPAKLNLPFYPSDEEISKIAAMPIEQIKSELAQMGALDVPIPTRSTLSERLKASSKYEAGSEQYDRVVRSKRSFKETRLEWLGSKSSHTLRIGVSVMALACLLLIVSHGSLLHLLGLEDNVTIPAPAMPDPLDLAAHVFESSNDKSDHISHSDNLGTKAPSMLENAKTDFVRKISSFQLTQRRRRGINTHPRTDAQLEANRREARESDNRTQHQLTGTLILSNHVMEITQKGKQDGVLVSRTLMRQPLDQ
jgi:hypothetical protein